MWVAATPGLGAGQVRGTIDESGRGCGRLAVGPASTHRRRYAGCRLRPVSEVPKGVADLGAFTAV